MRKLSKLCNLNILKQVYFSLVHSYLSYGIEVYGSTSKKNMDTLLKLQKKAIRIMMNLKFRHPVKSLFSELQILTVYSLYVFHTILCVFKLDSEGIINHTYNTRYKIGIDTHKLEFFKKTPIYMGRKFLKKIPDHIKKLTDSNKRKKELKIYMLNKPIYSIEEFWGN